MYKKLFSFFVAAAMAFIISFGGAACIATGFLMDSDGFPGLGEMMPANLQIVGLLCGMLSLVAAGYFSLPKRWRYLPVILVLAGYLWRREYFIGAMEAVLYRITSVYHLGYHWGVLQWTGADPGAIAPDLGLFLLVVIPGVLTAWTVCCGKNSLVAVLAGSLPLGACLVVTDTVPENWCLLLLLTGLLLLLFSGGVGKRNVFSANVLTALLLIPVLLFQSILFWAIPRESYEVRMNGLQQHILSWFQELPFVQMGADGTLGLQTGDSAANSVNLSTIGPRAELNFTVMEVTASREGVLYLRGQSLEIYNGTSWQTMAQSGKDGWLTEALKEVGTVTVETRGGWELFYFPYYPGGDLWTENANFSQGRLQNPDRERSYTFVQMEPMGSGQVALSEELRKQCLQLPQETLQRAQEYIKELPIASLKEPEAVAEAVANYVKSVATYDLNTQRMPSGASDFAMWFLESSDTGYCVHFASAATVLMRAAGIPARYVSGYILTASAGDEVPVSSRQAHAWVEYFDPSWGWRILEVTPPAQEPEIPQTGTTVTEPTIPETTQTEETTTQSTTQTEPDRTEETTPSTVPDAGNPEDDTKTEQTIRIPVEALKMLLVLLLTVALIFGQYLLRRHLRKRRMFSGSVNRRVLEQWREVMRMCRILKRKPPKPLLELAEKAKFSQHTLTAEERMAFGSFLEEARDALAKKPFLLRWAIRLIWAVA